MKLKIDIQMKNKVMINFFKTGLIFKIIMISHINYLLFKIK